eukprot:Tamp_18684.p1 GENE.Tamp_18684~~Tamp_18684.p1  ORF type:complete len:157 (+),score=1.54 Tamp_18684:273-743(+)
MTRPLRQTLDMAGLISLLLLSPRLTFSAFQARVQSQCLTECRVRCAPPLPAPPPAPALLLLLIRSLSLCVYPHSVPRGMCLTRISANLQTHKRMQTRTQHTSIRTMTYSHTHMLAPALAPGAATRAHHTSHKRATPGTNKRHGAVHCDTPQDDNVS